VEEDTQRVRHQLKSLEKTKMPRSIAFGLAILLICGIAGAAPSRESARAQDADDD
jgi:hypothetical protein